MDGSITSFVGIDIAKRSLDVCLLPEGKQLSLSYDTAGLKQLFAWLPEAGSCLIVVEATGGYQLTCFAFFGQWNSLFWGVKG